MSKIKDLVIISDEVYMETQSLLDKTHSTIKCSKVENLIAWQDFLVELNINLKNMLCKTERGTTIL